MRPEPDDSIGLAYGRATAELDAFWEARIAEAQAAGGSLIVRLEDIPPVPGVAIAAPSSRVGVGKAVGIEGAGPVIQVPHLPEGVLATGTFRLTVRTL